MPEFYIKIARKILVLPNFRGGGTCPLLRLCVFAAKLNIFAVLDSFLCTLFLCPITHRRCRRDSAVELSRVGGVY